MALTSMTLHRWLFSLGLAAGPMACTSGPTSLDGGVSPGLATIGPEGGQVGFGALVLTVPPGALTLETQIRVSEVSDVQALRFAGEPVSLFYRLEPAGLTFDIPAVVRFVADGVRRPQIVWSESANPTRLGPLDTLVESGFVVANVTHFSVGGVVELSVELADAGPTDVGADAGPADATPDTGPMDASPSDGPSDATAADAGASDAGATDSGWVDSGPIDGSMPDTGVAPAVFPATLNAPDACLTRTTTLSVPGRVVTSWSPLSYEQLQFEFLVTPYGNTDFDPATGVVTFWPTGTLSGYQRGFGVRAMLAGGGTVERVWTFVAPGLGSYAFGNGGVPVFTASAIPDVSRATAAAYSQTIAAPAATHPCSGVSYRIESTSNCNGAPGGPFMTLQGSGVLTVDPSGLVDRPDGRYCIRVHAEKLSSQVYFHTVDYSFLLGP